MITARNELIILGAGAVGLYLAARYLVGNAGDIAEAVPGVVSDVFGGVVVGTGEVFGIPKTNMTECERALAEGRTWDASFACPAGTFIKSIFD